MAERLELRLIDDDFNVGRSIGGVRNEDGELAYHGSRVVRDVLESLARRRQCPPADAFALLHADPWCNGKLVLQAASGVFARVPMSRDEREARRAERIRNFDPNQPRDDDGRFSESPLSKAKKALIEQLESLPGVFDSESWAPDDAPNGEYFDWSNTIDGDYDAVRQLEFGDNDTQAIIPLSRDERQALAAALAVTIMRDDGVPSDNPLVASMLLTAPHGAYTPSDPPDDMQFSDTGRYFDWGRLTDGKYRFEGGSDDTDTAQVELSLDELKALHASLTLGLLEDVDQ
jgi:hypothetical protein